MRVIRANAAVVFATTLLLAAVPRAEAQSSLDAARDLYAAAEYDGALTMLDGLLADSRSDDERRTIEMYRVLCLVATGREADAESAIESFVARNPLYRPSSDLPPRVRSTFVEARTRMLPTAAQSAYQSAKAAFDFKDYTSAERGFQLVLDVLADPDVAALATESPLADLRTLANGFHELSMKALAPPEPAASARLQGARAAALPPPAPAVEKVYSADDTNVVPPIAVTQEIPTFPGRIQLPQSGVIEVLIDRSGAVESASMLETINPQYDRLALTAARDWHYRPARLDGVPVKFLKRIQVNIVPNN